MKKNSQDISNLVCITKDYSLKQVKTASNEDKYFNFNYDSFKETLQEFIFNNPYLKTEKVILYLAFKKYTSYRLCFEKSDNSIILNMLSYIKNSMCEALKNTQYKITNLQLRVAKIAFNSFQNTSYPLEIKFSEDKKVNYPLDSEDLKYFLIEYVKKNIHLKNTKKIISNAIEEVTGIMFLDVNPKSMHQYFKCIEKIPEFSKKIVRSFEVSAIIDGHIAILDKYDEIKKVKKITDEEFLLDIKELMDKEILNPRSTDLIISKVLQKYTGISNTSYCGEFEVYRKKARSFLANYKKDSVKKSVGIYKGDVYVKYKNSKTEISYEKLPITIEELKKEIKKVANSKCFDNSFGGAQIELMRIVFRNLTGIYTIFSCDENDDTYIFLKDYIARIFHTKRNFQELKKD